MNNAIDTRSFEVEVLTCPLCNGQWKFYNGGLGYESFVCNQCGFDVNNIKITIIPKGR